MTKKLQFSGYLKETGLRVNGTGLNQIDGDWVLYDGKNELGIVTPDGVRIIGMRDYEPYDNPITTQDDLYALQDQIVEMIIQFCKDRDLKDIDTISFSVDGLQESLAYNAWTAGTDSSLTAYGRQTGKYKKIGEVL